MSLGPILLRQRFKNPVYYPHFVALVRLLQLCLQLEISTEDIDAIEAEMASWVQEFEKLYYQYKLDRLPEVVPFNNNRATIMEDAKWDAADGHPNTKPPPRRRCESASACTASASPSRTAAELAQDSTQHVRDSAGIGRGARCSRVCHALHPARERINALRYGGALSPLKIIMTVTISNALTSVLNKVPDLDKSNRAKWSKGMNMFLLGVGAEFVTSGTVPDASDDAGS
ncbi:hypothetical protein B0H11DRAFT_2251256 [Mycena galericulata]|nr:hypothetical protein B0H11DRAFT_2251256 [Mycena galericulata]